MITDDDRKQVESWGHVRLPPGARAVRFHCERGADPAIWIRLELPLAEREDFLRDAGFTAPLQRRVRYVNTAALRTVPWWRPDEVEPFESSHVLVEHGRRRHGSNILLGTEGDHLVVYLFVTAL